MKNKPKNFIDAKAKYEGMNYSTRNHGKVKVVEYRSATDVIVQFENTGYVTTTSTGNLKKGFVKDRTIPSVSGFGIVGDTNIRDDYGVIEKEYRKWENMLSRVYARPTKSYLDCSVSPKFQKYSDFRDWCNKQVGFDQEGWVLDKDILVKRNKVYSPETCCFVPVELNSLLVNSRATRGEFPVGVYYDASRSKFQSHIRMHGKRKHLGRFVTPEEAFQAYKQAKEAYIKEVAELYKDQIDIRVYEALMKYEVDIND